MHAPLLPFRQRLVGKMVLFGILPTVALIALIIGGNVMRAYELFERHVESDLADDTRIVAAELDLQNQRALAVAELVGRSQGRAGVAGDRAATERFLRDVLDAHPELTAIVVATESGPEPFRLELRRDRASEGGLRVGEPVDDSLAEILRDARRSVERDDAGERPITSVVERTDARGAASGGAVRYGFPILREGRFAGVAVVERTIESLAGVIAALGKQLEVSIALSAHGTYVGASADRDAPEGERLTMKPVAGSPLEPIMTTYVDAAGAVRVLRNDVEALGGDAFWGVTRLREGDWTLTLRRSSYGVGDQFWSMLVANSLSALVGVAAIAAVLVVLARGVGQRLERAVVAAKRIADGNLAEPVPAPGVADESGTLLEAFEQMTQNLNRIVGQVRHASIQINSTATELAATSVQLESTATGFGASASEVAAATRQISTTGEELLHTMQAVADSAAGAAEKAQESRTGLRSMQSSVRRLDDAAHSVAARLGTINEKAQAINAIVGAITKVADETNLLSVNAAIEAEKAGEFGLGFLIVAREIRRLADQTASATLDIERMIRQMQAAVAAGVVEMDRFGDSLRTVLDDVDHVGQRVQGIIAHVEDDTIRFVQVTEGMRSQAAGAKQIDEAMRTLSVGARRTIESAGEFGNAAGELQTAIGSLKSAVAMMRLREGS